MSQQVHCIYHYSTQTHEHCGLDPFWHLISYALTDTESFSCHTDVSCRLRRASKHRQYSWYFFSYLLSKPLPLTAVFTTAVCLFQKHNIAIICQLIPASTPRIVNSLQHTRTRAQSFFLFERHTNTVQNKPAHLATDPAISALCPR